LQSAVQSMAFAVGRSPVTSNALQISTRPSQKT
jgi:hypothetical protein